MLRIDARIPVRFGPPDSAGTDEALLVQGPVPPGRAGVRFELGEHEPACTCCGGRAPAAMALLQLFQLRARGDIPFFRSVLAIAGAPGQAAVRAAVEGDALASGRFRMVAARPATTGPAEDEMQRITVSRHMLTFGPLRMRCAVGRAGVRADKREGDGATPAGVFALRQVLYRPDRQGAPATGLPLSVIAPQDGWSDDPADPAYNRRTTTASKHRHEALWREDSLYDVLAVIGANDNPAIPGQGSAIFLHVARPDYAGTDGCVAVALEDLLRVLERCNAGTKIEIS